MSDLLKQSIWFGRLVLGAGALLFTQLGLGNIVGPVAVAGRTHTLGSPDAITTVRVQGGVFIGIAWSWPIASPPNGAFWQDWAS